MSAAESLPLLVPSEKTTVEQFEDYLDTGLTELSNVQMIAFTAAGGVLIASAVTEHLKMEFEVLDQMTDLTNEKLLNATGIADVIFDAYNFGVAVWNVYSFARKKREEILKEIEKKGDEDLKKLRDKLEILQLNRVQNEQAIIDKQKEITDRLNFLYKREKWERLTKLFVFSFILVRSVFSNLMIANSTLMIELLGATFAAPALFLGMLAKATIHFYELRKIQSEIEKNRQYSKDLLEDIKSAASDPAFSSEKMDLLLLHYAKCQDDYLTLRHKERSKYALIAVYVSIAVAAVFGIFAGPFVAAVAAGAALLFSVLYLVAMRKINQKKEKDDQNRLTCTATITKADGKKETKLQMRSSLHKLALIDRLVAQAPEAERKKLKDDLMQKECHKQGGMLGVQIKFQDFFGAYNRLQSDLFDKLHRHDAVTKRTLPELNKMIQEMGQYLVEMRTLYKLMESSGMSREGLTDFLKDLDRDVKKGFKDLMQDASFDHSTLSPNNEGMFDVKKVLWHLDKIAFHIGESDPAQSNFTTSYESVKERVSSLTGVGSWVFAKFSSRLKTERQKFQEDEQVAASA